MAVACSMEVLCIILLCLFENVLFERISEQEMLLFGQSGIEFILRGPERQSQSFLPILSSFSSLDSPVNARARSSVYVRCV